MYIKAGARKRKPIKNNKQILSAAFVSEEFSANAIAASGEEDVDDAFFAPLFDKISVAEGKRYNALNENLRNDPAQPVSEDIRQDNLEFIRMMYQIQK